MDVYILRHGVAEERGADWPDDAKRPLTSEGKAKTRDVAAGLRALGVGLDAIYTSPYVRARQTAEIVAKALGIGRKLRETRHLEPGGAPSALFQAIRESSPAADAVMIVGHEPDLGQLAARLVAADGVERIDLPLKKAGLARIEVDGVPPERRGVLRWFMPPSILRAVARK